MDSIDEPGYCEANRGRLTNLLATTEQLLARDDRRPLLAIESTTQAIELVQGAYTADDILGFPESADTPSYNEAKRQAENHNNNLIAQLKTVTSGLINEASILHVLRLRLSGQMETPPTEPQYLTYGEAIHRIDQYEIDSERILQVSSIRLTEAEVYGSIQSTTITTVDGLLSQTVTLLALGETIQNVGFRVEPSQDELIREYHKLAGGDTSLSFISLLMLSDNNDTDSIEEALTTLRQRHVGKNVEQVIHDIRQRLANIRDAQLLGLDSNPEQPSLAKLDEFQTLLDNLV